MIQSLYDGLSKRPTYDQVLGNVLRGSGGGIDFAFPDRTATFIRNSPEYQNLLTNDFIDLQKSQENMLKQQRREIIIKEQASGSNASMKSILARSTPALSVASEQVQSDLDGIEEADKRLKFLL